VTTYRRLTEEPAVDILNVWQRFNAANDMLMQHIWKMRTYAAAVSAQSNHHD